MSRCLDDNRLADIFGGVPDDAETAAVDAHVAGCDACRRLVGTYARLFVEGPVGADPESDTPAPGGASLGIALPSPTVLARTWAEAQLGGTVGGRWRLVRVLGIGGSAAVFEALHRNGSRVAIKIMRPEHLSVAPLVSRFMREAYVANQVEHTGVVRVIDDGTTDEGAPFLVMDLLEGDTLRERIERDGTLSAGATIDMCLAVLDVLAQAHQRGIVHRDLKPDNLFFDASGAVRVLDFGIARFATSEGAELTQTGLGMGTSAYMPPEQARGEWEAVGPRSDLWALAATAVYALGRRSPHVASNAQKTLVLAATTNAPRVASMVPHVRARLARALDHALAFDPGERPRDARAMADELTTAREDTERVTSVTTPPRSRGRLATATATALGILLVIVVGVGTLAVTRTRGAPVVAEPNAAATAVSVAKVEEPPASAVAATGSMATATETESETADATRPAVRGATGRPRPSAPPATTSLNVPIAVVEPASDPATTASSAATPGPSPAPAPSDSALMRRRH